MRDPRSYSNDNASSPNGYFYQPGALEPLESAAQRMGRTPEELRETCERSVERCGDVVVAHLPDGVVGFRTEGRWRFRFPVGHRGPRVSSEPQRSAS